MYRDLLIKELENKFGKLKTQQGLFECIGVMHEQDPNTKEILAHQKHYVPQTNAISADSKSFASDDEAADDDLRHFFMSLVGALAWLILTMPAICVYVAFLQRQAKAPTVGHIITANRLLAWIAKNRERLAVWYRRLDGPLRLIVLSDSAFKAQDTQGLVMRGCVIMLAEAGTMSTDSSAAPSCPRSSRE